MKVLFTKTNIRDEVSHKIGGSLYCDFIDVIEIQHLHIKNFDLKNKSLIFTSVNGVISFFENQFLPSEDFVHPGHFNKIYTIGQKTKLELRKHGFGTFKTFRHASELFEFIMEEAVDEKFLHFCGNLALDILNDALPLQNIWYKKVLVYETILLYPKYTENYDAVCFFSPSGVKSFTKYNSLENIKIFSIGETTTKELKNFTNNRIYTSKQSNLNDLLALINSELTGGNN